MLKKKAALVRACVRAGGVGSGLVIEWLMCLGWSVD